MEFLRTLFALIQRHLHVVLLPTAANRKQAILLQTDVYYLPAEVLPRLCLDSGQTENPVSPFEPNPRGWTAVSELSNLKTVGRFFDVKTKQPTQQIVCFFKRKVGRRNAGGELFFLAANTEAQAVPTLVGPLALSIFLAGTNRFAVEADDHISRLKSGL